MPRRIDERTPGAAVANDERELLRMQLGESLDGRFPWSCIARPAASSPATGSRRLHEQTQRELIAAALSVAPAARSLPLHQNA